MWRSRFSDSFDARFSARVGTLLAQHRLDLIAQPERVQRLEQDAVKRRGREPRVVLGRDSGDGQHPNAARKPPDLIEEPDAIPVGHGKVRDDDIDLGEMGGRLLR